MMQYNHLGLYEQRKKKERVAKKERNIDWINIFLLVLLLVVIVLFVVT